MNKKLNLKVKNKLTEYLEFDSDLLFQDVDYGYIFGGAIRDIIGDCEINDIDLLCINHSYKKLCDILERNGYIHNFKYTTKDIMSMYTDIKVIFEPTNFIKTSGNKIKTVQLIRPSFAMDKLNSTKDYDKLLEIAIYNVDINICGVYYHSSFGVKESVEDSIFFIKNKAFLVNKEASMFQNTRIFGRVYKLEKKGYICLDANYSNMYLNNPFMKDIKYEKFKSDFYKKL